MHHAGDAIDPAQRKYHSYMDAVRKMYAVGGISRFYCGYAPCIVRSVPANAACFFAYEKTKQFLDSRS